MGALLKTSVELGFYPYFKNRKGYVLELRSVVPRGQFIIKVAIVTGHVAISLQLE